MKNERLSNLFGRAKSAARGASERIKPRITQAREKAANFVDSNPKLSAAKDRAQKLQTQAKAQTQARLAQVRTTIEAAKKKPAVQKVVSVAQSTKDTVVEKATPHVRSATGSVKAQATRAKGVIETKATEVQDNIIQRAVGIFAHALMSYVRNPETFQALRTQLSENVPNAIKTRVEEVNSEGLTPQRQLRKTLGAEDLDGIRAPIAETLIYPSGLMVGMLGLAASYSLNKFLRLTDERQITQADMNSLITEHVAAPTMNAANGAVVKVYRRVQDTVQSRFSSGHTQTATA